MCFYFDDDDKLEIILESFKLIENFIKEMSIVIIVEIINAIGNLKDFIHGLFFTEEIKELTI